MSGFEDDWLALREPADARARDEALAERLVDALRSDGGGGASSPPLHVLDLGAGTGANLRWLAPWLGGMQRWTLVDGDAALLERAGHRLAAWAGARGLSVDEEPEGTLRFRDGKELDVAVARRRLDLAAELDALPFAGHELVTASALLDLAGADWLDALAGRCAAHGNAVLIALSYDGRLEWAPALDDDEAVHERFDRHQRQDKGLGGVSLGPDAVTRFVERLQAHGLESVTARSDWQLGGNEIELQRELMSGLGRAAGEIDPAFRPAAGRWLDERLTSLDEDGAGMLVGHLDVLGLPPRLAGSGRR